ncbi:MAG TPA: hypothetical protein VNQ32_08845 [Steroidobacteraceae bacterium]|nr:hypothetical protein [Steroidobacteraceae bacterium]
MFQSMIVRLAWMLIGVLGASGAHTMEKQPLSDAKIRDLIVGESIASYPGNCPCPYNTDRAGRKCGARSAWSKPGGRSPTCYANEVSAAQVRQFRSRQEGD